MNWAKNERDEMGLSEKVREIKEKVLNWLKEEALSPDEVSDPNAYFNFGIRIANMPFNVVQNVRNLDSIFVGTNIVLSPSQQSLIKDNMDKKKRQEYFWNLRLALLMNNELGEFQIKPSPPNDVREIFVSSKRVFYDGLTKNELIHAIHSVFKAVMMIVWMLERHAGIPTPKEKKSSPYVA